MRKVHFFYTSSETLCSRSKTEETLETTNASEVTCKACKKVKMLLWDPKTRSHKLTNFIEFSR